MEKFFAGIFWNFSEISFNPASCKTRVVRGFFKRLQDLL